MRNFPRESERLLRRLDWTVLRRLDGLLQGDYRSLFRGFGLDLAGLREYQVPDDVRHIDWNVTARLGDAYVRQYHEDREITAWFLLDLSPSVDFGSMEQRKRRLLIDFTAMTARILTRHGNRVGALFFGGEGESVLPPGRGTAQVLRLLDTLLDQPELPASPPTDLNALFLHAQGILKRRSLVFVVSDFFSDAPWAASLGRLVLRHEVTAVRLTDPMERDLPDLGFVLMRDAESGESLLVDTHDSGFRRRFSAAAQAREAGLRIGFREAGVDVLELSTDADVLDCLLTFMAERKLRRRA